MTSSAGKNCKNLRLKSFSFGSNIRTLPVGRPYWRLFLSQFNDGLIILLMAFAVLQFVVCVLCGHFI